MLNWYQHVAFETSLNYTAHLIFIIMLILFQVLTSRLLGTKPLLEPMLTYCQWKNLSEIWIKYHKFHYRNDIRNVACKSHLFGSGINVLINKAVSCATVKWLFSTRLILREPHRAKHWNVSKIIWYTIRSERNRANVVEIRVHSDPLNSLEHWLSWLVPWTYQYVLVTVYIFRTNRIDHHCCWWLGS